MRRSAGVLGFPAFSTGAASTVAATGIEPAPAAEEPCELQPAIHRSALAPSAAIAKRIMTGSLWKRDLLPDSQDDPARTGLFPVPPPGHFVTQGKQPAAPYIWGVVQSASLQLDTSNQMSKDFSGFSGSVDFYGIS